jgi:hypothetical protein
MSIEVKKCGHFAASWIPREGLYFSCVLPEGHEGECRPGGSCKAHGEFVGLPHQTPLCPRWPDCVKDILDA